MDVGNLYSSVSGNEGEIFQKLLSQSDFLLERIISTGHATASGTWLESNRHEWVVLLSGSAALSFEGEASQIILRPGDYVTIPAHVRHRVEWTTSGEQTVWLALHYGQPAVEPPP